MPAMPPPTTSTSGWIGTCLRLERLVVRPRGGRPPATRSLAFSVAAALSVVHPGDVLADVDHLEEEGVQARLRRRVAERVLVQERRAGRHDDPVELVLADVLLDQLLAGVGAHVLVVARDDDARERARRTRPPPCTSTVPGDVGAAVADVEADPECSVAVVQTWAASPSFLGSRCARRLARTSRWRPSSFGGCRSASPMQLREVQRPACGWSPSNCRG